MPKPSIAQLLLASGHANFEFTLVMRAIYSLYGNIGANLDERNWDALLQQADPLAASESALRTMYQDSGYLLRNAQYVATLGYPDFAPEVTYRQMSQRLGYTYSGTWSQGSSYAAYSLLSDAELNAMSIAYSEARTPPTIGISATNTGASLVFSHGGQLGWGVSGAASTVAAGALALVPAGVAGVVREGAVTLTRDTGVATTSSFYVLVATDTPVNRLFSAAGTPLFNRLIVSGAGADTIAAGQGNDTVYGGDGADDIIGNQGSDRVYGGNGNDSLEGGQGDDTVEGGADNDTLWGGSSGTDRLSGGTGADQFRVTNANTGVTMTDFSLADGDTLAFRDGVTPEAVNFSAVTNGGTPSANLLAADFDAVASVAAVRSDTGGANAGNNQVYVITATQTTAQITAAVASGALNAYVVVYDSTQDRAKIYFDADWSDAASRVDVATVVGLSAAQLAGLTTANLLAWFNT